MPVAAYAARDTARRVAEPSKQPARSPFARDRARVLHSWALRRLADKTQALLPGESDFPRTRLTHTLEVAQLAREMGAELGCDPDLTDTAGLCHDVGHPPFGHNGEAALDRVAAEVGGFEGNAQSLRVLTRLEPKVFGEDGSVGLNLTRATLDSMIKYPWPRRPETGKFNVYADDLPAFDWVREGAPAGRRCLEAQVMDWADDVAYSVHDIEDALYSGYLTPDQLQPGPAMDPVLAHAAELGVDPGDARAAFDRLRALPCWPGSYTGSARSLARVKATTSALIGRFCHAAVGATRETFGYERPLSRYDADLVVPAEQRAEVAVLKAVAFTIVFQREGAEAMYASQRALLTDLVAAVLERGRGALNPAFVAQWDEVERDADRLRVAVDQVASLTDVSAVRWHARLVGPAT